MSEYGSAVRSITSASRDVDVFMNILCYLLYVLYVVTRNERQYFKEQKDRHTTASDYNLYDNFIRINRFSIFKFNYS